MEDFKSLLDRYKLTEEDCNKQVTDCHFGDIARSYSSRWQSLSPELEIESLVVDDIDHEKKTGEEKRKYFFSVWKQKKGSGATYECLIRALLKIQCRADAEGVCKLLQESLSAKQPDSSVPLKSKPSQPASDHWSDSTDNDQDNDQDIPEAVRKDLKQKLELNLKHICNRYASYVSCIRRSIKEKGITAEELCAYLLNLPALKNSEGEKELKLLSDESAELERALTVDAIFITLSKNCCSFLDYDIFHNIMEEYNVDQGQAKLKYPEHLKAYIESHKLSEFIKINPLLDKFTDVSKKLVLKFDIKSTCTLAKLMELTKSVANILGLAESALRLLGIAEGCVEVTLLISPSVADTIFTSGKKFMAEQEELQTLSVIWLKYNGHLIFDFRKEWGAVADIKKIKELLNCSICLDTYTNPKQLQCHHVYCQKCLMKLVVRDQQEQLSLTCPTCRQDTLILSNGVAGLQPAFLVNQFLEIVDKHKNAGDSSVSANIIVYCTDHKVEVKHYCETCGQLICFNCTLKSGKHHSHDYEPLVQAFKRHREEITSSLEPMEKQLTTVNEALAQFNTHCDDVSNQRVAIEADINNTVRRLHEVIDARKTELINQFNRITQRKLKCLAAQMDQIETTQAQLHSCLFYMKESLKTGNQAEKLVMRMDMVKQVNELTAPLKPDMMKPDRDADITFSSSDITAVLQNYGQVSAPELPDPSECHATGEGVEVGIAGQKSIAILQAINFKGQHCEEVIESTECKLLSNITGAIVRGNIERRGQSQYEISYQPTIKGMHQLHIRIEGKHIKGSPFRISVVAKSPVEKLESPILTICNLNGPRSVALNQRGEVVVTEGDGHCVSVLSPSGKKLRQFGTHGTGHGQFNVPCGVAVDGERNILVADKDNHRIQKFTAGGQFLTAVGTEGRQLLQFDCPFGIIFNSSNNKVYVADVGNHRVQVLNSNLTFSSTFGMEGNDKGQFNSPWDIACDSTGNIYVADTYNCRIQVFTAKGKFLRMFGRNLNGPVGIAVDTNGQVYVSEWCNRVSVFTSEGQFVNSFGREGEKPGEFDNNHQLAVDNSGVVFVCDTANHRVQMF